MHNPPSSPLARYAPPAADLETWIERLQARFGFPDDLFRDVAFVRRGKKFLFVTTDGQLPPAEPPPETIGLPVVRLQHRHLKLTTDGAMLWGRAATRNVAELSADQVDRYLRREPVELEEHQLATISGRGFVIVRHRGHPLGVALFPDEGAAILESLYPKAYALSGDASAFAVTRGGS